MSMKALADLFATSVLLRANAERRGVNKKAGRSVQTEKAVRIKLAVTLLIFATLVAAVARALIHQHGTARGQQTPSPIHSSS